MLKQRILTALWLLPLALFGFFGLQGHAFTAFAALVMVLHEPGLADRYCDRALLLYGDGRHEIGPCREMLNADRLATLYGHPLKEVESDGHRWFIPT